MTRYDILLGKPVPKSPRIIPEKSEDSGRQVTARTEARRPVALIRDNFGSARTERPSTFERRSVPLTRDNFGAVMRERQQNQRTEEENLRREVRIQRDRQARRQRELDLQDLRAQVDAATDMAIEEHHPSLTELFSTENSAQPVEPVRGDYPAWDKANQREATQYDDVLAQIWDTPPDVSRVFQ